MKVDILIFCIIGGYLLGSFSIARLVTRIMAPGRDLEAVELPDANTDGTFQLKTVGATTASMILGPKIGGLIGVLDILKSAIPTLALRLIFPDQPYFIFAGATIVIGHIWPIYYGFRGGAGLSPALGTLLVLDPLGTLVSVILAMLIGMFILKEIAFIVMGGPLLFIVWIALRTGNWFYIIFSIFISLILFVAVIPDVSVQLRARKAGKTDLPTSMETIPMGKMMNKMMKKMGLSDEKTNRD